MRKLRKILCKLFGFHKPVQVESMGINGCKWKTKCRYCGKEIE